jgi:hypothetical protein
MNLFGDGRGFSQVKFFKNKFIFIIVVVVVGTKTAISKKSFAIPNTVLVF